MTCSVEAGLTSLVVVHKAAEALFSTEVYTLNMSSLSAE